MSFSILYKENKIVEGIEVFRIIATDDFDIGKEKILKGTLGGWIDLTSEMSNDSWIDPDSFVINQSNIKSRTQIKNSKINKCTLLSCTVSDSKLTSIQKAENSSFNESTVENSNFSDCLINGSTLTEIPFAGKTSFDCSNISRSKIIGSAIFFKTNMDNSTANGNITFFDCVIKDSTLTIDKKLNKVGAYLEKSTINDSKIVFTYDNKTTNVRNKIYGSTISGHNELCGIFNIYNSKIVNNVRLFGNITINNSTLFNGFKFGTTISGKRIGVICTKKIIEEIKSGASLNEEDAFIEVPIGTATVIRCDAVKKFYSIESESRDTEKTLKDIVKKYKINTAMLLDGTNSKDKNLKYLLSETFLFDQKKKLGKLVDLNSASEDIKYLINICLLVIQLAIFYSNKKKSFKKHVNSLIKEHSVNVVKKRCAWEEILFVSDELIFLLNTIQKNVELNRFDVIHIQKDSHWAKFLR